MREVPDVTTGEGAHAAAPEVVTIAAPGCCLEEGDPALSDHTYSLVLGLQDQT